MNFSKVIPLLFFALTSGACAAPDLSEGDGARLIYIMRHVDKAAGPENRSPLPAGYDPDACVMDTGLNPQGVARAEAVRDELRDVAFAASFSSPYCRTAHTAMIVTGIAPTTTLADPANNRAAFMESVAAAAKSAKGPVLLVMHSNWMGALFAGHDASIDAPSWAAPQCYGDVRAFRIDGARWTYAGSFRTAITDRPYFECENGHTE